MAGARAATLKLWDGVRMRRCAAAAEPDAPPRDVTLPAVWDDAAAAGLAALVPEPGPVDLATAAEMWLQPVARRSGAAIAAALQRALLQQRLAPSPAGWGAAGARGMRLNLAAFAADERAAMLHAAGLAVAAAAAVWPGEPACLSLTGLAGCIAVHGLDYDSLAARTSAYDLLAALRAANPGVLLAIEPPDAVDAVLGVETAGLAPSFGPLEEAGPLSRTARTLLAARNLGPEAALAAVLGGQSILPTASMAAHAAMHAAMHATLAPLLDRCPAIPAVAVPAAIEPRRSHRQELPSRRGGVAHKAVIGGQKVYLRTGEFPDGRPGEVAITVPQAAPAVRALIECLSQAISIGLQHGAPVAEFIDALAGSRFGPAGTVEGDPSVLRASSAVDYVMRRLADTYARHAVLPPVDGEDDEPPLLPLDLPQEQPRRRLRVVK